METKIRDIYHAGFLDKRVESQKSLISKLNNVSPDTARTLIRETVNSEWFADTFLSGNLKGWPVGMLPVAIYEALKKAGVVTSAQIVIDNVQGGKFRKHPEVSVEQYKYLQHALDHGEVLLERPGRVKQGPRNTLLIHYRDGDDWWRYVANIKKDKLYLLTVFRGSYIARQKVLKRTGLITIKPWDEDIWQKKHGA